MIDFKFAVAKIGKNPSIFQEKMKKSFTRTAFLTLPRGRNNNRYAGGLLSDGQFDDETTSASIRCIEDEVATEVCQMTLGECQTQPKTFGKIVDLGEHLEKARGIFRSNTRSRVLNDDADSVGCPSIAHDNILTIGILGSIVEQFAEAAHEVEMVGKDIEVIGHFREETDLQVGILSEGVIDALLDQLVAIHLFVSIGIEFLGGATGGAVEEHLYHTVEQQGIVAHHIDDTL